MLLLHPVIISINTSAATGLATALNNGKAETADTETELTKYKR